MFFQKKEKPELCSEMLDEVVFWKIIARSLDESSDEQEQEEVLIDLIQKLTLKEMIGFRLRTDRLLYDTYNSSMWCAAYIINGGCSDDGFEYFRNWLISRGKDVFYKVKENPDNLIEYIEEDQDYYEFESFWYVALVAFKNKTGKDLYDYIDNEKFITKEGNYPKFELTWAEDDPKSMKAICPRLYERFLGEN